MRRHCLLYAVCLLGAACRDAATSAEASATRIRPEVTFAADGPNMSIPAEVPSGHVDVRVTALDDRGAHLLIGRLHDGITYEQFEAAPPTSEGLSMITVVGGNGAPPSGAETLLTVRLDPGRYTVVNIFGEPPRLAYGRFRVSDSDTPRRARH